jgi:hypothetical protein
MSVTSMVGFWSEPEDNPEVLDTKIDDTFLAKLTIVEKYSYRQECSEYSVCRICNKSDNGDSDITTYDMLFVFPSGYRHYLEEHNVHPPKKFYEYVINFVEPTPLEFANLISLMLEDIPKLELTYLNINDYPVKYHAVLDEIPKLVTEYKKNNTTKIRYSI